MTEADSQDERGGERERSTPCGLLAAAAAGSNAALEHLLPAIETQLLLRIRLMMGRAARRVADSHDFLAGVMHDLVEQARGGRMPGRAEDLVRWASAIARNNIRDSARKQHEIRLADLTSTVCGVPERQDGAPSPAEQVEFDEQTERLAQALARIG